MRVGVLGGGQLARMMALAGHPLGLEFAFLDPAPDACAFPLGRALHGAYDDPARLDELADFADVVTFEFENVPAAVTERLSARVPVYPPADALAVAQNRLAEKTLFRELGIGTSATHMEWFFGPKGLKFSEIGCRPPGVGAWDLYCAANDFDLYLEWAMAIAHGRPSQKPSRRYSAAMVAKPF